MAESKARPVSMRVAIKNDEDKWVGPQRRAYMMWASAYLEQKGVKLESLVDDMADGDKLLTLLECLIGYELKHAKPNGKGELNRMQMHDNVAVALDAIKQMQIPVTADAGNIVDKDEKMVLGLMFSLIRAFHINLPKEVQGTLRNNPGANDVSSEKRVLMAWVNEVLEKYPNLEPVTNFHTDWSDGRVMTAMVDNLRPGELNVAVLNAKNGLQNLSRAFAAAERMLDVPQLLDPEDVVHGNVDENVMITYVSYFRRVSEMPDAPLHSVATIDGLVEAGKEAGRIGFAWLGAGSLLAMGCAWSLAAYLGFAPEGMNPRSWTRPT